MYYGSFEAKTENIPEIVKCVEKALKKYKIPQKEITKKLLIVEEALAKMIDACEKETNISVRISKILGDVNIKLLCEGKEFDEKALEQSFDFEGDLSTDEVLLVKDLFKNLTRDKVHVVNKLGINICTINVNESEHKNVYISLIAIALGIIFGLLCKYVFSNTTATFLCDTILQTIYTILSKALKMIVPPLIFFAIACNIGKAGASKAFSKNIKKMLAFGFFTSCICILIGLLVTKIIPFDVIAIREVVQGGIGSTTSLYTQSSITETLISIVPDNVIAPIINGNMLQLIFVSMLVGFAVSFATKNSMEANNVLEYLYDLCLRITAFFTKHIYLLVFSSIAILVYKTNINIFASYASCIIAFYIAIILVALTLLILFDIFTKENPDKFFKSFFSVMITGTTTCSTATVIPRILEIMEKRIKIPKRLYSILVPLGLFLCKSGTVTFFAVFTFIGIKIYGVGINMTTILLAMFIMFILSFTAPPIPCGSILVTTSLFPMFGVSANFTTYILAIYAILDFGVTFLNIYAECMSTCIIAKTDIDFIKENEKLAEIQNNNISGN